MLIAFASIAVISILLNLFLDNQFKAYIIKNQENNNREILRLIQEQYNQEEQWDTEMLENIGVYAMQQGLIIKITNSMGQVIWDATEHNNGMCQAIIANMAFNMMSRYPNWKGGYEELEYTLYNELSPIGSLSIGYYGPFYYNDGDLAFSNTMNKMLLLAAAVSLFFSVVLGMYISRRISNPISKAIETAKMIGKGYFETRISESFKIKELHQLTSTINHLADTLQTQEELRKRLVTDVAHELRTPLTTLQGHMEAMIDGIWKPEKYRLESCHSEIIRISKLVRDIEKLSKLEKENLILNKTTFNLHSAIQGIIHSFENELRGKDISLELKGENVFVYADMDKLTQVFINLLSNAIKYTQANGEVSICINEGVNEIEIMIKDNGIGISDKDLPHIFERFYRADKSRNRMTGGTGIGLTITEAIINAHNGTISVQSKVGVGTEFTVKLPA